jgi:hypothetical protein
MVYEQRQTMPAQVVLSGTTSRSLPPSPVSSFGSAFVMQGAAPTPGLFLAGRRIGADWN